ncbi:MAG: ABC transporter ATP-binding protein [Planctomycetes bacterium]|nr:ABC transporter ATP-binding protein [Planctomycetota bacterium]
MLEIKNVSKTFDGPDGKVEALKDTNLSLKPGEFLAIHGPSGSGKSTLLLTAAGMLAPDKGKVFLEEQDFYSLSVNKRSILRSKKIGFVFQQFCLVNYLSVAENIMSPSAALGCDNCWQRAKELMKKFNLEHRANHYPAQLSTGERQRVAMARAMFNNPAIIMADEPTGNLDEDNSKVLIDFLLDFKNKNGAVIIVTHDSRIIDFADRSIKLNEGMVL